LQFSLPKNLENTKKNIRLHVFTLRNSRACLKSIEKSSSKCKFHDPEWSYFFHSKHLGYLITWQVLICFLHIKRSLNFKFTFEHEITLPKTPLKLNNDVLIRYKEKKTLNNINKNKNKNKDLNIWAQHNIPCITKN
jgi:hypothetical protein